MTLKETVKKKCPAVGMRNIKTATAAALCALVYYFFDRSPAFACIGAIFAGHNHRSKHKGKYA